MADSHATSSPHLELLEHAARSRGVDFVAVNIAGPEEIASAIETVKASGAGALNFLASPLFAAPGSRNFKIVLQQITALHLPAIFQWSENAEAGALAGYGPRITDLYRQRARIAAQVLRGIKPANIPVQQPDHYELVINLQAAKAIGHEVPAGLVARADKVIE